MFEPFLRSALKSARSIVVIISTTHHSQFEIRPISKDLKVALEQDLRITRCSTVETIDLSPPQPTVEGPRGPFSSSKPRLTYVSLPPDYELFNPWVGHPGCVFSLCVDETGPKSREYASYARGWDEPRPRDETTLNNPAMNIFGPLLPRFQNVKGLSFAYNDVFQSLSRECFSLQFRFGFKRLGQIREKRRLLCHYYFQRLWIHYF